MSTNQTTYNQTTRCSNDPKSTTNSKVCMKIRFSTNTVLTIYWKMGFLTLLGCDNNFHSSWMPSSILPSHKTFAAKFRQLQSRQGSINTLLILVSKFKLHAACCLIGMTEVSSTQSWAVQALAVAQKSCSQRARINQTHGLWITHHFLNRSCHVLQNLCREGHFTVKMLGWHPHLW